MNWNDVRHFLALARHGAARTAAEALGVSHSTVVRRIEALEQDLGARLFDRNRDGYVLTEAGRQTLPAAADLERDMAALERALTGRDERLAGFVSVTCTDAWISGLLMRELVPWCADHPDIELGFTVDPRPFDLSRREADIALRIVPTNATPAPHLIGRRVAPMVLASYVARDHAALLDPERPGATPRWLGFEDRKAHRRLVARSSYPDVVVWGSFGTFELLVQAACEGAGCAPPPGAP